MEQFGSDLIKKARAYLNMKKKYKSLDGKKQSVLWTVYHTVLAVELALVVLIEFIELIHTW